MKKGFTLMELMAVIVAFTIIMIPLTEMLMVINKEIPFSYRIMNKNTSLINAIKYIEEDIKKATAFPSQYNDIATDVNTLLIEVDGNVICYNKTGEKLTRKELDISHSFNLSNNIIWSLPDAFINYSTWENNNGIYALEIQTGFEIQNRGVSETRLANSYVFYVNEHKEIKK